jgi:putative transposase
MNRYNRPPHRRAFDEVGHAHELTFSCYRRFPFLAADRTCRWLADAINRARISLDFSLWAYVFMPDHVHLIIDPRQPVYEIRHILKAIKEPVGRQAVGYLADYAPQWLPRLTRQRGRRTERLFWQSGGGYDRNITDPDTLRAMIDYTHLNPVRRGLVTKPADWKWSSAGWLEFGSSTELVPDPVGPEMLGL